MAFPQKLSAVLLDDDATTLVTTLPGAFGHQFVDGVNETGQGSILLAMNDSDRASMTQGRYVRVSAVGITGPVFTFKIEGPPRITQIRGRGRVQEVVRYTGRGWGCMFDEAIVLPEDSIELPLDASWRLWSFASPGFPNAVSWGSADELYEFLDGVAAERRVVAAQTAVDEITEEPIYDLFPAPLAFPWPYSPKNGPDGPEGAYTPIYWIKTPDSDEGDEGFAFFRGEFTLTETTSVTIDATADNLFTLYLQGVPILGERADTLMWQGWKNITLDLPAGTYTVGAVVENIEADLAFNPYGLLVAMYVSTIAIGEVATFPSTPILMSDSSWIGAFTTDEWPGYTPGQILDQFTFETLSRGALASFAGITCGDFVDSAGDPWDSSDPTSDTEFIPSFATRIGSTGLDMLDKLVQEGWIDWHFGRSIPELDVWAQGSAGETTSVEFQRGVNIAEGGLERGASSQYANALLVQWGENGGYVWVEDAVEIASYGTRVEDIYTTDAATQAEAERLGRVELRRRRARDSIRLAIEPTGTGDVPYEDFNVGDYVTIPNVNETGTELVRVMSIAANTDDKGYAIWSLELNERWLDPQRAQRDLFRAIAGKTMGSVRDLGIVR